ncbi:transglutaminase-like domain-containing protein [Microbulbifer hainanensis]|uniref:transglutaminase-like domain-containing protein n=1 Tax=Microbulbifer hainanensis TaxID=2735675 RepID=UPI001867A607|nr:transglutaminase-like domain-containing protein [Microbulbifer hainanensis]
MTIGIGIALVLPELAREYGRHEQLQRARTEETDQKIQQFAIGAPAGGKLIKDRQRGVVRVQGSSQPLTEEYVQRVVDKRSAAESAYMSVWNWQGIHSATASARGLDSHHHFANSYLVGFKPFTTRELWVPLYTLAIRKEYQYDYQQYAGLADIWQTSRQAFYQKRGDCEDHALLLADWLIELGVDARVALGTYNGGGHAWVVAIVNDREYLLEATSKRRISSWKALPLAELAEGYDVEFQFNRHYFWAKKTSAPTRKYRGNQWIRKSQFIRS